MTERYIARTLLHLSLAFTTLGANPAQFNGDECTSTDKKDDSIFIVSTDEGIPMRINARPDSRARGTWSKGTELFGLCWRFIPDVQGGVEQQTVAHYMRSPEDGRRGWVIAYYDRPGLDPMSLNPAPLDDQSSFFDKVWDAIEQKRRAIFEELFK